MTQTATSPAITPRSDDSEDYQPSLDEVAEDEVAPEEEPSEDNPNAWVEVLQADTPPEEIHQRALMSRNGPVKDKDGNPVMLDYVTARYVQDRLDLAVGPANWQSQFNVLPDGSVQCGISIRVPDEDVSPSEWVTKWDVGTPSSIEPQKGAHSDAFKRAGVQWGIARDLYSVREDERLAPEPQTQPTQATVQQRATGQAAATESGMTQAEEQAEWRCPLHDDVKIVPAGVSKKTGRAYASFYACPVAGCDQKGPSLRS